MAGSLTDGSTETFWESGDEDRNKAKWVQVNFAGGTVDDRPHIVCVHIDNTRDTLVSRIEFYDYLNKWLNFGRPYTGCLKSLSQVGTGREGVSF